MVYYSREDKELVIPTGIGNLSECDNAYSDGYADGAAAQKLEDDSKITPVLNVSYNGEYEAEYGYKKVIVNQTGRGVSKMLASIYASEDREIMNWIATRDSYAYIKMDGVALNSGHDIVPAGTHSLEILIGPSFINDISSTGSLYNVSFE